MIKNQNTTDESGQAIPHVPGELDSPIPASSLSDLRRSEINPSYPMTTGILTEADTENPASGNLESPASTPPRRFRSKIAALLKEQRDVINKLLLDGSTYVGVVRRMAEQGVSLNPENVSTWYQTGFQDHLAHLERLDHQRAKYEAATDLLQNIDVSKIPEAGLQTAAAQIYDLLDRFSPEAIAATMADEPDKYIRMVNSLSRLTREALAIKKYTDARSRAALRKLDVHRKLGESENRAIVRKVDEVFGLASISDPPADEVSKFGSLVEQLPEAGGPAGEGCLRPACAPESTVGAATDSVLLPGDAEGSDLPFS